MVTFDELRHRRGWTEETVKRESPTSPRSDRRSIHTLSMKHQDSGRTGTFYKNNYGHTECNYKVKIDGDTKHTVDSHIKAQRLIRNEMDNIEVIA